MRKKIEANKECLIIFFVSMIIYFGLGLLFSYYFGIYKYWNVLFDMDTPRVFGDLTSFNYNHYRAAVHPLFILFFQPLCKIINLVLNDYIISGLLIQSIMASISVICVYKILKKFKLNRKLCFLLTCFFGLSFGQMIFSSSIETYIFAQALLLLMWLFFSHKNDRELSLFDYVIIVILGIFSISITVTNFFQFLIVLFFLVFTNKKIKNRFFITFIILFLTVSISVFLANVQNILWPSAPNFFTKTITDLINKNSEETLYISKQLGSNNFINIFNATFAYSFNFSRIYYLKTGAFMFFENSKVINYFSLVLAVLFIFINIKFMVKNKVNDNKIYYSLLLSLAFNWGLHLFYGNGSTFLYICHFNFLVFLIIGYIFSKTKINRFENSKVFIFILVFVIALFIRNVISVFILLLPRFNTIEHFRFVNIIILFVFSLVLVFLIFKNKKVITTLIIIIFMFFIGLYKFINYNNVPNICDEYCEWNKKFEKYSYQLKELKNEFMIESYEEREEPIGVMYFGMADRRKMVYKNGKLIDGKTHEIIRQFDYDEELIIPNEYTVILKKDGTLYRITEDKNGVYLYTNNDKEKLSEGNIKLNLPDFSDRKYSEILKVLHQEILFNIDGSEPKPNVFGYKQAYYRDAMLVSMALETTNNVSVLNNWVRKLDKIYDNSRSDDIDETDNLGELLYIIGATGVDRPDLIDRIQREIRRLKDENGYISGMVDGQIQTYYPTLLAIFGAKKAGIDVNLSYPINDDAYAKLTWYSDYRVQTNILYSGSLYPYLSWGFYHYSGYGKLFMLDEIYPLTYEGGENSPDYKLDKLCFISDYYCEHDLYISHLWTASEMLLFLKDF